MSTVSAHGLRRSGAISRRELLGAGAAGLVLAGLPGCQRTTPREVVPLDHPPPELVPGQPLHYATALVLDGYATGMLATTREGRPVKLEGNPEHPASLGATTAWQQAALHDLYDPARMRTLREGAVPCSWEALAAVLRSRDDRGEGLRLWLEPTSSPLRAALLGRVLARFPAARVTFESLGSSRSALAATSAWAGRPLVRHVDLAAARRIVTLDADPLGRGPMCLAHARAFARGRRPGEGVPDSGTMSRIYALEPVPSRTGSVADVTAPCTSREVAAAAGLLLRQVLAGRGRPIPSALEGLVDVAPEPLRQLMAKIAADLVAYPETSLVLAGEDQPPEVHVVTHVLADVLGHAGRTAWMTEPALVHGTFPELPLLELLDELRRGVVDTLVVASGDVVYEGAALGVAAALGRVPTAVYWGHHDDETAARCRFVVPAAHDLESWGDARAYDGTLTTLQPLLPPLDAGVTVDELLAAFVEPVPPGARTLAWQHWIATLGSEDELRAVLRRGYVPGSTLPAVVPAPRPEVELEAFAALARRAREGAGLELALRLDDALHGGRFASNAWLQEMPDPLTKLTWGNALRIAPALAERLHLRDGQLARVALDGVEVEGPVVLVPGHADDVVSIALGHGRRLARSPVGRNAGAPRDSGAVPASFGVDAWPLVAEPGERYRSGAELHPLPHHEELVRTQELFEQHDRKLALAATLGTLLAEGDALTAELREPPRHLMVHEPPDLARDPGPQWGMAIDLGLCTGCSACVVACQVENNIPAVGREEVLRGREMHWLRIDRWHEGHAAHPRVIEQPMLCQHCELAPCEYVCPVAATTHSPDGLNEMTYNRCVGTRFCSNNCPYYVRRFNWFDHSMHDRRALAYNPDVTVRERGVMEKCTYCVQRIRRARIAAAVDAGHPGSGDPSDELRWRREVVTACQQACPTGSILFGDLTDEGSAVVERLRRPERFAALHEQGTRPRTRYLAKITNPPQET